MREARRSSNRRGERSADGTSGSYCYGKNKARNVFSPPRGSSCAGLLAVIVTVARVTATLSPTVLGAELR